MLTVRGSQMQDLAESSPNKQIIQPCEDAKAWIEFRLVDQNNQPVPSEPYRVLLPDQSIMTGTLDSEGKVRFEGIIPGQASICFTDMDEKDWRPL
jgi:protocatechuate 3,4-dioxygenase beta subunit